MGKLYDIIDADLKAWIEHQKVFFVATAPLSPDGRVNCSPKGGDTFRVIGAQEVAYLDWTGSGIETIADVQENGRILIMFCAFDGPPKIVRLHGSATALFPGDPEFERLSVLFPRHAGTRAVVKVSVSRVSDSCGYAVPLFDFVQPRDVLDKWTDRKTPEELVAYRAAKNRTSIDGLPGMQTSLTQSTKATHTGSVVAVSRSGTHSFSKKQEERIRLVAGIGVEGDAHAGETVKHRSRVAVDPTQPNLRQVHLIHAELHEELLAAGFKVLPSEMGENITTRGLDLLGLPTGARLHLGAEAVVEVTGLRNPCSQLDRFLPGLRSALLSHDENGKLIRKAGVMGIVLKSGVVEPGDRIQVEIPSEPHVPLDRV